MAKVRHPVLLVILDGWGYSETPRFNAIHHAKTPHWDRLWAEAPHGLLRCSGLSVGLPDDQMGNSEVGHMHLGAGRLIYQDFTRINEALRSGEFQHNPALVEACMLAASRGKRLHIMGLLSPGGVHSHEDHLIGLIEMAAAHGVAHIHLHAFLDGRDTPPKSARASLERVSAAFARVGRGGIASLIGRYYAMDRNKAWERTALAHALIVDGHAEFHAADALEGLALAYARGESDEFVKATAIHAANTDPVKVEDGDVIVFANFRADRARQITRAFTASDFNEFPRGRVPALGHFVAMTDYGAQFAGLPVAFPTVELRQTFGELVATAGLRQLRIAETEKYAHVTFFFNGGEETVFAGEDRVLVPSPTVATYDLKPEMSAGEVTDKLVAALQSKQYDAIICNYANADMVGHTGDFDAAVRCIETLDACIGRLVDAARATGTEMLITADHGNAEQMRANDSDADGEAHTAHTSNPVPLIYVGRQASVRDGGCLSDIAPTLLALMGLAQPPEMTGTPLVTPADDARHAA
jgi:2,3-bisphosphoglycerate-independent phosphoglycerate mutase